MVSICFLTEGGQNKGYGHITRCSALYEAFEELNCLPEMILNGEESLLKHVPGIKARLADWIKNPEQIPGRAEIIVIDSYLADEEMYKRLSENYSCTVFLDDNIRMIYPKGIVLNGAINAQEMPYPGNTDITYLLGSNYTPLRKIFKDVPARISSEKIKTILVTTGGNDNRNLIPGIIDLFRKNMPTIYLKILVTEGFLNLKEIKDKVNYTIELIENPDANCIKEAMQHADLAISSAGQTLYELARMGLPAIAIQVADNQKDNARGWQKVGFVEFAGNWNDSNLHENILQCFKKLSMQEERSLRSGVGQKWMDGLGARRVAKKILERYFENMNVRKATPRDIMNVFELSNDDEVRKNSFTREKIEFSMHEKWFNRKICSPDCLFLVAENKSSMIGQVRFDIEKDAVISLSIHKDYRNMGIGGLIMKNALRMLKEHFPATLKTIAFVKVENIASKRYFEKCNFKCAGNLLINDVPSYEYHYDLKNVA